MAYYFMGGEDLDFSPIGRPSVSTNATTYRSTYARCSLATGSGQAWRVPASYGLVVTGVSWLTARCVNVNDGTVGPIFHFNGPGDAQGLTLWSDATIRSGAGTHLASGTGPVPYNALTKMDIYLNFTSSGGVMQVFFDGDLILTYTGDTTGGFASYNGFDLTGLTLGWSEVMWADHDTRALSLITLPPVANGVTNTWDVHNVTNLNQVTFNDAQTDQSGTAAQIDLYTVGGLPAGNYGIDAVEVVCRAVTAAAAPQNLQLMVRAGGTNYNSASIAQGAAFQRNANIWLQNPNTSTFWQQGDLGAGFNTGMESIA